MSNAQQQTFAQLDKLLSDDEMLTRLPLGGDAKYAILSDLHLGDGGGADNLVHNEEALVCALEQYRDDGYAVILVGDIEELWQFDLHEIRGRYDESVYSALRSFPRGKVHRVYGNHDMAWSRLGDPAVREGRVHRWAAEGILLGDGVLIAHGHQGELFSDRQAWLSRTFVRLFRYVEPLARRLGWGDPAATQSWVPKSREQTYYRWAKAARIILICGHTHRAFFGSRSRYVRLKEQLAQLSDGLAGAVPEAVEEERDRLRREIAYEARRGRDIGPLDPDERLLPCYFNTGCGCYTNGLTNLEIEGNTIRLVKWHKDLPPPPSGRREVFQEDHLDQFLHLVAVGPPP